MLLLPLARLIEVEAPTVKNYTTVSLSSDDMAFLILLKYPSVKGQDSV